MNVKVKTAVILAAGLGSRLKEITRDKPKGFIVLGEGPLIEQSVRKLEAVGIERIIIGTGYLADQFKRLSERWPGIECIKNEKFADTGSMYTLYNLRERIAEDFLLLESDLLYDLNGLRQLLSGEQKDIILSSDRTDAGDGVYIEVDQERNLVNMSKEPAKLKNIYSELVGITKISRSLFNLMCRYAEQQFPLKPTLDYEYVLVGVSGEAKIFVNKMDDYAWCEIDDEDHLRRAKEVVLPKIKEREK